MKTYLLAGLAAIAAAGLSTTAQAADFSFTGIFVEDDDKQAFDFNITTDSNVTFQSFGFAGGVNAAGQTILAGGFSPVLSLYNYNSGQLISYFDFDEASVIDPVTGRADDPFTTTFLTAGSYIIYISQYDNYGPENLALPFIFEGQPNFANGFVDFFGFQRNGNYALDISNVAVAAAVPEASTWALMLLGFGAAGAALRRRSVNVTFGRSLV